MGSGAFLVGACRYLAGRLVDAWLREGKVDEGPLSEGGYGDQPVLDTEAHPLIIEARRGITENCLYGVDINPMAVEMAKLSLWLVSMDPPRPFTFLDDRLVVGDSLLGITSLEQLEYMHLDPKLGRKLHENALLDFTAGVRSLVAEVAEERQQLGNLPGTTLAELAAKRRVLAAVEEKTAQARLYADLVVGSALAGARQTSSDHRRLALEAAHAPKELHAARTFVQRWLATDLPGGSFKREPLHWPPVFPEVFEVGGYDAIVGARRFSAARRSAAPSVRVPGVPGRRAGEGVKGNADLFAYFVLRAHELLNTAGQTGVIATNTLARGDTREVGLDQIFADGTEIRQAVKTEPGPSRSAVLQYCAIWTAAAWLPKKRTVAWTGVPQRGLPPRSTRSPSHR